MREEITIKAILTWECDAKYPLAQQIESLKSELFSLRNLTKVEVLDISPEAQTYSDQWADDQDYPVSDWKYQIENNDTRRGYWDWVEAQRE